MHDLIAIGSGSAASTAARKCRKAGWSVAIIDERPFGGTCSQRGCDPKKVLVDAAHLSDWSGRMQGHGASGKTNLAWNDLFEFKQSFVEDVPEKTKENYEKAGIDYFHGTARFTGKTNLEIDGRPLSARHILLAGGAAPVPLPFPGADLLMTSDDFLDLPQLPQKIVFAGGGYISFEFAHIAARAGAEVTILEEQPQVLGPFDPFLVDLLVEHSRNQGIKVELSTKVTKVEKAGGGFQVTAQQEDQNHQYQADLVVHGAGRVPQVEKLDLEKANIEFTRKGVTVNQHLQSVSNPAVYAAGDIAAPGPPLTPVSGYHSRIVAANLLEGNHRTTNHEGIPSVCFTIPPLAMVGLSQTQAERQDLEFEINQQETSSFFTSRRVREECSGFKVLIEKQTGRILGAHLLGHGSEHVINVFSLAIRHGLNKGQLRDTLFAYPTREADIAYML